MKKYTSILIALLFICPIFSTAQKVKIEEASELAKIVFKKYNQGRLANTKDIIPLGSKKKTDIGEADTLLYIVPFVKGGYAIISGDKVAPPYLGYCPKGDFRESDLPPGLDYLLEKYKSKISKIKKDRKPQNEDIKKQWEEIYDQNQLKSVTSNVAPMLDTEWGQQSGFNDSVPNNYPAGCTAVAMAQILRYWECRVNPTGSLTWTYNGLVSYANFSATNYWWLNMNNSIGDEHNAQLIYHAGVSCQTKYKSNGSTSTPGRARDGFVNYWGMDNDADVKWRMWHLNNWKDMLVDELHDGRPILYSAGGAEIGDDWVYGHSWVIDGVTVDHRKFWCNWGWYGNHNGWYELGDFKPEDDNYNQMESAIFNVYPEQSDGVATPGLSDHTFTYSPNGYTLTIPPAFGATSYQWITDKGTISGSGTSVTLNSESTANVQVRAYNGQCDIYSPYKSETITVNYGPISSPDVICYSGSTVSITNVPSVTITWGGTNVSYPDGDTGTSVTVRATSSSTSGIGSVTASFTVNGTQHTITKTVWVGVPIISSVSGPSGSQVGSSSHYLATIPDAKADVSSYNWSLIPSVYNNYFAPGGSNCYITWYTASNYVLSVNAQNTCGTSSTSWYPIYVSGSSYLSLSPNPATSETTVSIEFSKVEDETLKSASNEGTFDENTEWDIEVYDSMQSLKLKKNKLKGKNITINTQSWKEGVYMVRAKFKDEILTGKLVVK